MKATLRIRRFQPQRSSDPYWQEFEVQWEPGKVVLYALHDIHERVDGSLAYRYSCRGAICGSCAVRINGAAALACKTQFQALDTSRPIVLEPLLNMPVVRDLVVDHGPFFASIRTILPYLSDKARDGGAPFTLDRTMDRPHRDQYLRSTDCILCQSCFSDCPKRREDPSFEGPATCLAMYKRVYHPQEEDPAGRLRRAAGPGGVFACDQNTNCNRVCPKNCLPLRAIMLLRFRAKAEGLAPDEAP
jgi:succinate dehydrogenase / fumarate reductase iron-sulfur subunit